MEDCLRFIVSSILGTNDIRVSSEKIKDNQFVLIIEPDQNQIGALIGKKGRIINAIRKIMRIRTVKEGKNILIKIKNPEVEAAID